MLISHRLEVVHLMGRVRGRNVGDCWLLLVKGVKDPNYQEQLEIASHRSVSLYISIE
jgi:hypothetical protein